MAASRSPFTRSIFADELTSVLTLHQSSLEDLKRRPISLDRKRIDPLIQSLDDLQRMPALNYTEMASIFVLLKFQDDEQLRIYSALIALGVQRLTLEYLPPEGAWRIAYEVRESSFSYLRQEYAKGNRIFDSARGGIRGGIPGGDASMGKETGASPNPLATALNAYDHGTALATMGQMNANGEAGRDLIEEALLWFTRAAKALDRLPPSVRASEEWRYWRQEVEVALEQAKDASQ